MPATLHPVQARTADIFAKPSEFGCFGKLSAAGLQIVDIADRLVFAPLPEREMRDLGQVGLGAV